MAAPSMMPSSENFNRGEGQLSQEFKEFLATLPRENWLINDPLYQYQGFWVTPGILQAVMRCQTQFKAQPTDIFLVTTPKSGTTWIKALAFATVNRVSYLPDEQQHPLLGKNPHELVPFVDIAYFGDHVPDFSSLGFDKTPRIFATHLPYMSLPKTMTSSKCKIVYLCRNPKDTLVSLWFFVVKTQFKAQLKGHKSIEEQFEWFCKGVSVYGPFWDHVLGYWKQSLENPERVCFMKFEDIKREPVVHLRKLAEFMGCPFSLEEENQGVLEGILKLCSFDNLSNLEVNKKGALGSGLGNNVFFRRGEVGDWVNNLTPEMGERLDQITEEKLHGSSLKF